MFKKLYRESVASGFNALGLNEFGNNHPIKNHPIKDNYVIISLDSPLGMFCEETPDSLVALIQKNGQGDFRRAVIEGLRVIAPEGIYATHQTDGTKVVRYYGPTWDVVQITTLAGYWHLELSKKAVAPYKPREVLDRLKQRL